MELFEQVWSAENFKMFKAQMVRKNIELELQALILLQYQLGLVKSTPTNTEEDAIMAIVIKKSKDEYDALTAKGGRHNAASTSDLETAKKLVKSDRLVESLRNELDQQDYLNRKIVDQELSNTATTVPK